MPNNRATFIALSMLLGACFSQAQANTQALEAQFSRQLQSFRLSSPASDNAAATLNAIEKIKADHPLLRRGPVLIAGQYVSLAQKTLARDRRDKARSYIKKALRFDASHAVALQLHTQLSLPTKEQLQRMGAGLVPIPSGCFSMGSPVSEPLRNAGERQHDVCVDSFAMAKHEVTYREFDQFTDATGQARLKDQGWGRGNRPVSSVSWRQANDYARWMSEQSGAQYRLPTEAEWEYAARASSTGAFYTGEKISKRQANVNTDNNNYAPRGSTQPVGRYAANPWGLHDMHGNVWEWCLDRHGDYAKRSLRDPTGPTAGEQRVLRGGSWFSYGHILRAALRYAFSADRRAGFIGFRLSHPVLVTNENTAAKIRHAAKK